MLRAVPPERSHSQRHASMGHRVCAPRRRDSGDARIDEPHKEGPHSGPKKPESEEKLSSYSSCSRT